MESQRFLECLAADAARLRDVGARDLTAAVPSCPGWNVADLVKHTAQVYLHKIECMRHGTPEGPWPPPGTENEEPLPLFDRAYLELTEEFAAHKPSDASPTWYTPDQTVGFWIRRMAQETVIHRWDAELALNETPAPIPDDLAVDGVDEVLRCFLEFATKGWPGEFGDLLKNSDGAVAVRAGDAEWLVKADPSGVSVSTDGGEAAATVSGAPAGVLGWLWGRAGDESVAKEGDPAPITRLRELLVVATQ